MSSTEAQRKTTPGQTAGEVSSTKRSTHRGKTPTAAKEKGKTTTTHNKHRGSSLYKRPPQQPGRERVSRQDKSEKQTSREPPMHALTPKIRN